jgi:putative Mn2+ efflux pump MntP
MIVNSLEKTPETEFKPMRGVALPMTSLSISLDSLGVGMALPAMAIELLPMLPIISFTRTIFTLATLPFGAGLGERCEPAAERMAGVMLFVLAALFTAERLV